MAGDAHGLPGEMDCGMPFAWPLAPPIPRAHTLSQSRAALRVVSQNRYATSVTSFHKRNQIVIKSINTSGVANDMKDGRWGNGSFAAIMAGRHEGVAGIRLSRSDLLKAIHESASVSTTKARQRPSSSPGRLRRYPARTYGDSAARVHPRGKLMPEDWETFSCLEALRHESGSPDPQEDIGEAGELTELGAAATELGAAATEPTAAEEVPESAAGAWSGTASAATKEPWHERLAYAPRKAVKPPRTAGSFYLLEPPRLSVRPRPQSSLARLPGLRLPTDSATASAPSLYPAPPLRLHQSRVGRPRAASTVATPRAASQPALRRRPVSAAGSVGRRAAPLASHAEPLGTEGLSDAERGLGEALRGLIASTGEESPQLLLRTLRRLHTRPEEGRDVSEEGGAIHGEQGSPAQRVAVVTPAPVAAVDEALLRLARETGETLPQLLLRSLRRITAAGVRPKRGPSRAPRGEYSRPVLYGDIVYQR